MGAKVLSVKKFISVGVLGWAMNKKNRFLLTWINMALNVSISCINKIKSFMKDHKFTLLQIIPTAVSVIALVAAFLFNREQNIKWNALNQPQIMVVNIKLIAYEELDTSLAIKRKWGYATLYHPVSKDGVYTGRSRVYSQLIFWDEKKNERKICGEMIMTKMEDVKEEIKRLRLPPDIKLRKRYAFQLIFRNTGQLPAKNIRIRIQIEDVGGKKEFPSAEISLLAGGEIQEIVRDFYVDSNAIVMAMEHFTITSEYEYAGEPYKRPRKLFFNMFGNEWGFE